eukprot:3961402-Lingulodinium_polyedra.AAC.1
MGGGWNTVDVHQGMAKLCMKVAEKDLSNLQRVFDIAKDLANEKKDEPEASESSDQSAADVF